MPRPKKNIDETIEATNTETVDTTETTENTADPKDPADQSTEPDMETKEESDVDSAKQEKGPEVPTVNVAELLARMEAMQKEMDALKAGGAASSDGTVKMIYINPVSERNEVNLGDFGVLRGSTGFIEVPRRDFGGKFMTNTARYLLDTKRLIVTDGLTPDERVRYKLDYPEDSVMSDRAFDHLLSMNTEKIVEMFKKLCPEHQQFVARRFITAYEEGDNRIGRDKIERLNQISKGNDPDGMFKPILQSMNKI